MTKISNFLTIDVEDYFQVAAFDEIIRPEKWGEKESRIEANVGRVLSALEEHGVKGTFFVVGWIAEHHPRLVKQIASAGHEIGCHSYLHQRIHTLSRGQFREDTHRAKSVLEGLTGREVVGYRAPTYSITERTLWALDILVELGFLYDSSIFPIRHDLYGIPAAPRFPHKLPGRELMEYPISTALILGRRVPVSGGGYFRLFPYWFTHAALRTINRKESRQFIFYLHPWEMDPGQPRFVGAPALSRFRHYNNLEKTEERFRRLLRDFSFAPIRPVDESPSPPVT